MFAVYATHANNALAVEIERLRRHRVKWIRTNPSLTQ